MHKTKTTDWRQLRHSDNFKYITNIHKSSKTLRTQDPSISRKDSCDIHWIIYIFTSSKFNAKWRTETMNGNEDLTSWGLTIHTCYTIYIAVNKSGLQNLCWSRRKFLERKRALLGCSPDELIKLLIDASLNIICCFIIKVSWLFKLETCQFWVAWVSQEVKRCLNTFSSKL